MMLLDDRLNSSWWALRIGIGLTAFLAGLDKFFNLLTNWGMYLSPIFQHLLPVAEKTFMYSVGVIEMLVGLAVLARWTRIGAYVASAWLLLIAANLISSGTFLDLAVRDVVIAIAAYALARMTELREQVTSSDRSRPGLQVSNTARSATTA
jgi:uncharacterized membrane protein YphA (DoxX/SURF4 family)